MYEQTKDHIRALGDADLLEYVLTDQGVYEPDAVAFAREELKRRNLSAAEVSKPAGEMPPDIAARIRTIEDAINFKQMHPRLSEEEIRSFEIEWGIEIPAEYRWFLLEVGDGGSPLHFKLLPLGYLPHGFQRNAVNRFRNLTKPFPFTDAWVWEDEENVDPAKMESVDHGALIIGDEGCAQYWLLIVTGPQRGKIWSCAGVGIYPFLPPSDFLTWLQSQLGILDGPCPQCGYDFRATPGRCPECGYGRES